MPADDRLDALLLRWEELYEQGQDVPAEELCRDCPELAAELVGRIAAINASRHTEKELQCHFLHDLFGPLLFRPATLFPARHTEKWEPARRAAEAIYRDRAFDQMPLLADVLSEAGCE